MATRQLSIWTPIAVIGAVLFAVFLALGYGLIGLCFIIVLGAMAGGAILYWVDGESDR
ncbi:MAG TPA: hypothetical protein VFL93_14290 [Longimicrobiaceae bacterium]|jgi:hypothetical protein|nr:hypothetical protein [Longimicrobiaceae bacterium]